LQAWTTECSCCHVERIHAPGKMPCPERDEDAPKFFASRVELEERARTGRVTKEERSLLLEEPFEAVSYSLWRGPRKAAGVLTFITIVAVLALTALTGLSFIPVQVGGGLVAGVLLTLLVLGLSLPSWHRSRKVIPLLVRSLRSLAPTREELRATLERVSSVHPNAKRIDPDELATRLDRQAKS